MRLGRLFIILAFVIIIVIGGALVFINQTSNGTDVAEQPAAILVDVVIVAQFVPRGGTVTAGALGFAKIPASEVFPEIYILDPETVEGARARYDLHPGVFLSSSMLLSVGEGLQVIGSDTSLGIHPGKVAIAIPIDRFSSVGYGVQRGDHVNIIVSMLFVDIDTQFQTKLPNLTAAVISPGSTIVLAGGDGSGLASTDTLEGLTAQSVSGGAASIVGRTEFDNVLNQPFYLVPSEASQRPRFVSQTIMQDVVVVYVGNFPYGDGDAVPAAPVAVGQPGDPNAEAQGVVEEAPPPPPPPDIITLMVFPQEAVTLNYLILRGARLTLVLRASGDDSRVFTEAVTLDWLLAQHNIPIPTRLPYGFEPSIGRILSSDALRIINAVVAPVPQQ